MLSIYLININELTERIAGFPNGLHTALLTKYQALAGTLLQNVRDAKLSGGVLNERTGLLKNSIASALESDTDSISASVFVSGDVPYAAIQEYGGDTKAHVIVAVQGRALAFNSQGKQSFFRRINHPGSVIPEHSYLRSALEELQDDILSGASDALDDIMNGV